MPCGRLRGGMRELVFALEYEPGCNRVADALADHPDARVRSLSLHATAERLWRVDHATGTPDALDAIEDAFHNSDYYADCLATEDCGATQTTRVLDRTDGALVLYSDWERTPTCASVPHIARDHLGDGVLFETRHEGRHYTWRLIHSGEGDPAAFFDDLGAAVGECARLEMLRTADTTASAGGSDGKTSGLSPEQEAALRAAVEHGYYESPREVDVGELAEHLDVPRSTLTYRLRRAEEHLAKQHVAGEREASERLASR
jgi:predicted DNA binding protein